MSRIVFQIPESGFHANKKTGEPLRPFTEKLYTSKLNALAKAGYPDIAAVWANSQKVIKVIKDLTGDGESDSDNMKRRQYLSAIFAVSPEEKTKKSNWLYRYYQKCLPDASKKSGKAWVPKKDYLPE
jgi:hypothetical protein